MKSEQFKGFVTALSIHFFWLVVLPVLLLILTLPLLLPTMYSFEKQLDVNASEDADVAGISEVETVATVSYSKIERDKGVVKASDTDYRVIVLDEFFKQNDSPLYGHGADFVEACDTYGAPFDCTTLPAIGYVETRLCGFSFSHAERNCWGWGGSPPNRIFFPDYETAIDTITKGLVVGYGTSYMLDPVSMQYTYCGAHCHRWGGDVQSIRLRINRLSVEMGYPPLIRE